MATGKNGVESAVLQSTGVTKSYAGRVVLAPFDLRLQPNEVVCVIGPSGAGKSTLLRVLAGLETPDAGDVTRVGSVGMVFQQGHLWPHKTVLENVALPLRVSQNYSARHAHAKAAALLETLGVAHLADAFPDSLSGGEAQRVAIARALALEPGVLLLDEVTSALDAPNTTMVADTVRDLAQRGGRSLVIVTHNLDFARDLADRVLFMENGAVVDQGHPHHLFFNSDNPRTRAFVQQPLPR